MEERKRRFTKLDLLYILMAGCFVMSIVLATFVYRGFEAMSQRTAAATWRTPTRMEINAAVAKLILAGQASRVYDFYAIEVGDPVRAALYIQAAQEGDGVHPVPIDFAMSLGWYEGGHQIERMDGPNQNGSFDVRPMGLNTYTYKTYSVADLQRIEVNIPFGVQHLMDAKDRWDLSFEAAAAAYNKGAPTGLDQRQIDYVVALLRHEWELDRRFAAAFPEMF